MLFGAAIGSVITNPLLAIILALLGHYFLDIFPHVEYSIDNLQNKNWKKILPDAAKVFMDFTAALLAIFLLSKNQPIIYFCAMVAIIPDGLTMAHYVFPKLGLAAHDKFHGEKIHYLTKQKKFPVFWRIATQVLAVGISIAILT